MLQTRKDLPASPTFGSLPFSNAQIMADFQTPTEASQLSTNGVVQKGAETQISADDADLFSSTLISPTVKASLQEVGYTIRPLRRSDYNKGIFASIFRLGDC